MTASKTPDEEPRTDPRTSRWLIPPAASLVIHAGLAIALTAVTIEATKDRPPDRPARVTLTAPAAAPAPQRSEANNQTAPPSTERAAPNLRAPAVTAEPASITQASEHITTARGTPPAPRARAPEPIADAVTSPSNAGGPRVGFADIDAAPARTVVFVVDASGAVATAFTFVREELLRSIDRLSPTQRFQVVVFPGPDRSEPVFAPLNQGGLALASPAAKRTVAAWMETFRPRGRSQPLAGLRLALALEPDICMLITRSIERTGPDASWGDGLDATMRELDQLNPIDRRNGLRRTSIAAVQLLDEDPTGIMPAIAAVHGSGVSDYRVVTAETLIAPEDRSAPGAGAGDEQAIEAAAEILSDLDSSGIALRIFHGLPNDSDRSQAGLQAERAAALASRSPDDARARVLAARAQSIRPERAEIEAAIAALNKELLYEAEADAWRRLAVIDALAALGRTGEALERLDSLVSDAEEIGMSLALRARAMATRIALDDGPDDIEALVGTDPFLDATGTSDPYWVLALAEAQARARIRSRKADPTTPILHLLERAEREQATGWVPILNDRISRIADIDPDALNSAPARARLLAAHTWARSPQTRERATRAFARIASEAGPWQAEALWELGILERSSDTQASRAAAADRFSTLALRFPDHPMASDAMAGAIALTEDPAELLRLLAAATEAFPERPEIELWRYRMAELSAGAARLDTLDRITAGTREATLALPLYAATTEQLLTRDQDPASRAALLERAAAFFDHHKSPEATAWFGRAADATLDVNTQRALRLAERAIDLEPNRDGTPGAQITAALALIALDREPEATERLVRVATTLGAAQDRSTIFWQSWTLLLEIAGPDDPASARAHLARLELIDPDLGGDPWRRRLDTLRRGLETE